MPDIGWGSNVTLFCIEQPAHRRNELLECDEWWVICEPNRVDDVNVILSDRKHFQLISSSLCSLSLPSPSYSFHRFGQVLDILYNLSLTNGGGQTDNSSQFDEPRRVIVRRWIIAQYVSRTHHAITSATVAAATAQFPILNVTNFAIRNSVPIRCAGAP